MMSNILLIKKVFTVFAMFLVGLTFGNSQNIYIDYNSNGQMVNKTKGSYRADTLNLSKTSSVCLDDFVTARMRGGDGISHTFNGETTDRFSFTVGSVADGIIEIVSEYPGGCTETIRHILEIDETCGCSIDSIAFNSPPECNGYFIQEGYFQQEMTVYTSGYNSFRRELIVNQDTFYIFTNTNEFNVNLEYEATGQDIPLNLSFADRTGCTFSSTLTTPDCVCSIDSVKVNEFIECGLYGNAQYNVDIFATHGSGFYEVNGSWARELEDLTFEVAIPARDIHIVDLSNEGCELFVPNAIPNNSCDCQIDLVEVLDFTQCGNYGGALLDIRLTASNAKSDYYYVNGVWSAMDPNTNILSVEIPTNGDLIDIQVANSIDENCIYTLSNVSTPSCGCEIQSAQLNSFSDCTGGNTMAVLTINATNNGSGYFYINDKYTGPTSQGGNEYEVYLEGTGNATNIEIVSDKDENCTYTLSNINLPNCNCIIDDASLGQILPPDMFGDVYQELTIQTSNTSNTGFYVNNILYFPINGNLYEVLYNNEAIYEIVNEIDAGCSVIVDDGIISAPILCQIDSVKIGPPGTCDGTISTQQIIIYSQNKTSSNYRVNGDFYRAISSTATTDTLLINTQGDSALVDLTIENIGASYCNYILEEAFRNLKCPCGINFINESAPSMCIDSSLSYTQEIYISSTNPPGNRQIIVNNQLYYPQDYYTGYSFDANDYIVSISGNEVAPLEIHFADDSNCSIIKERLDYINPCLDDVPSPNNICMDAIELSISELCNYERFLWENVTSSGDAPTENLYFGYEPTAPDIWFSFIADYTGSISLSVEDEISGTPYLFLDVDIFEGTDCNELNYITHSSSSTFHFNIINQKKYFIRVSNSSTFFDSGIFDLCLTPSDYLCKNITILEGDKGLCNPETNKYTQKIIIQNRLEERIEYQFSSAYTSRFTENKFDTIEIEFLSNGTTFTGDSLIINEGICKIPLDSLFSTPEPCQPIFPCEEAEKILVYSYCQPQYVDFSQIRPVENLADNNCRSSVDKEYWIEVAVPPSGYLAVEALDAPISFDGFEIFGGTCNSLSPLGCTIYKDFFDLSGNDNVFIRLTASNNVDSISFCLYEPCNIITDIQLGGRTEISEDKYDQDVVISFSDLPYHGFLIVNNEIFNPTQNPLTITLIDLPADGNLVDLDIYFTALPNCPVSRPNFFRAPEESEGWENLFTNVDTIWANGAAGPIKINNSEVVPLIAATNCDNTDTPVFTVAKEHGQGRVLGMAHERPIVDEGGGIDAFDNLQFFKNSFGFLNNGNGKRIGLVNYWAGSHNMTTIISELTAEGYTFSNLTTPLTASQLQNIDVLFMGNDWRNENLIDQAEINIVTNFVNNGGGALLMGLGWSWPNDLADYPMNRFASSFGFEFITNYHIEPINNFNSFPYFVNISPNIDLDVICPSNNDCQDDLLVDYDLSVDTTLQAVQTLSGNKVINSPSSVIFQAGQSLTLLPGFHAKVGATFIAKVEDCTESSLRVNPNEDSIEKEKALSKEVNNTRITLPIEEPILEIMPNPFNVSTKIRYKLPRKQAINLKVYNLQGQLIQTIENNVTQEKGVYEFEFTPLQESNMYIVVLITEEGYILRACLKI